MKALLLMLLCMCCVSVCSGVPEASACLFTSTGIVLVVLYLRHLKPKRRKMQISEVYDY